MWDEHRPYLGTYTPEAYYNMQIHINPYGAKRITREACINSGTSQYNPIYNQDGDFKFNPIDENSEMIKAIVAEFEAQQAFYEKERLKMAIEQARATEEKYKKSIFYKLYRFFTGGV